MSSGFMVLHIYIYRCVYIYVYAHAYTVFCSILRKGCFSVRFGFRGGRATRGGNAFHRVQVSRGFKTLQRHGPRLYYRGLGSRDSVVRLSRVLCIGL